MIISVLEKLSQFTIFCILISTSADFGLSKIASNDVQMSTVCGTPGYCGKKQY